jgi:nucleoside-diphosphate-sugar epimerase
MKIFITGGTGFIGSAVVNELSLQGHKIIGLARSEKSKGRLAEMGAEAFDGQLEDLDSLRRGAKNADAVIHLGFVHDFANFAECCETDKRAVEAMGGALAGTNKPFIVTSGVPTSADGHIITENDESDTYTPRKSEQAALPFAKRGVKTMIVRPSRFVHGDGVFGFVTWLINIARDKGGAAYIGDGTNCLHAVHKNDLAQLYCLVLEKGENGAKYQGVADFSIPYRDIAEAIGKRLGVPAKSITAEQAGEHFGFLSQIVGAQNPASAEITQTALGWKPTYPALLDDLRNEVKAYD